MKMNTTFTVIDWALVNPPVLLDSGRCEKIATFSLTWGSGNKRKIRTMSVLRDEDGRLLTAEIAYGRDEDIFTEIWYLNPTDDSHDAELLARLNGSIH